MIDLKHNTITISAYFTGAKVELLNNEQGSEGIYSKITANPLPKVPPTPWMLGTSEKSALLAAKYGIPYSFGHFMSDKNGPEIVSTYKEMFTESSFISEPHVLIAISVICAESTEEARELALSPIVWSIQTAKGDGDGSIPSVESAKAYWSQMKENDKSITSNHNMIIGNPKEVREQILELVQSYKADEVMIVTNIHRQEDKLNSFKLIAEQFKLQ